VVRVITLCLSTPTLLPTVPVAALARALPLASDDSKTERRNLLPSHKTWRRYILPLKRYGLRRAVWRLGGHSDSLWILEINRMCMNIRAFVDYHNI
jgi:hypothetical protein